MGGNMKNNWLSAYKKNITSQRGEDGILEKIFEVLEINHGWCVDVGAYGIANSNTYSLIKKGWSGILIESDRQRVQQLKNIYHDNKVNCIWKHVEPEGAKSLESLLKKT